MGLMKRNWGYTAITLCLLIVTLLCICLPSSTTSQARKRLKVVTSISVLEDIVKNIGGERVEVTSLITGLETPHTFNPKPSHRLSLMSADIFVKVGMGLESWTDKFLDDASSQVLVIETCKGVSAIDSHDHEHGDPHIWLDPERAIIMSKNILDGLIAKSPEDAEYFEAQYIEYVERIRSLSQELKARVDSLEDRRVIVFPASYSYLLEAFDFQVVATAEEIHGQELSAKKLKDIIRIIREEGVKVIITERQFSDKDAGMVAEETGAKLVYLTPLLAPQLFPQTENYLGLIRYNVEALIKGLGEGGM